MQKSICARAVTLAALLMTIFTFNLEGQTTMKLNTSKGYKIRRAGERGFFDHGWLKTYHTFSFADYYDPQFMGYRTLRVINEDTISPGHGFPTHGHKDMEILTILLEGSLAHKDSMDHVEIIQAQEIQAMSAGAGVSHSEYNPSSKDETHLLQIWITPDRKGVSPRYQQVRLPNKENEWILLASKGGEEESLRIHQDVKVYALNLTPEIPAEKSLDPGRYGWIQVTEGSVDFRGEKLKQGDGVALDSGSSLALISEGSAKILFFDLN